MKLETLILTALLALSGSAFAASPAPAAGTSAGTEHGPMGRHFCEKNAQDCKNQAAKFDHWCGENADKCTELKAFIERRREWCENNKAECKEVREQARADRKEWCEKHPDRMRCKAMNTKDEDSESDSMPPS